MNAFEKSLSHVIFYLKTKLHCLLGFILYEKLGNMCIAVVCFPGCNVINFEVNLILLIKPFVYMTKKARQNFKYQNKNSF